MCCNLLTELIEAVQHRTHRSSSRRVSIAADLPRQINQRNDDGKCADELTDCTNRFPIHGMIQLELDCNLLAISACNGGRCPRKDDRMARSNGSELEIDYSLFRIARERSPALP